MKNSKVMPIIVTCILAMVMMSCKSTAQRETDSQNKIEKANRDYEQTKAANALEWNAFKEESYAKIKTNEERIREIKVKMNEPGKFFDGIYRNRIEKLEAQNAELKQRISNYDGNQTQWTVFKNEFNRDLNEVGKNIGDLFR